ncbi:unnamed protein product [Brugia pahangi]|uniref:UMA domain-containing protein n=1 Tax=Brugia pahangi TaxID=6280 RepID=A0A0N4T2H7_BRUPA|nr:unnamed protein product [Brugia pahangi]
MKQWTIVGMNEVLMIRSSDMDDENNITKTNKTNKVMLTYGSPVRYLAITRDAPQNTISTHVVTDLCVVKDNQPNCHGFYRHRLYSRFNREKSFRKYLYVLMVTQDSVVDVTGEIMRKPPKNYSSAGEIDDVLKALQTYRSPIIIRCYNTSYQIYASCSTTLLYSSIETTESWHSTSALDRTRITTGVKRGVEDVPFRLNPQVESTLTKNKLEMLPELKKCDSEQLDHDYCYYFILERVLVDFPIGRFG